MFVSAPCKGVNHQLEQPVQHFPGVVQVTQG